MNRPAHDTAIDRARHWGLSPFVVSEGRFYEEIAGFSAASAQADLLQQGLKARIGMQKICHGLAIQVDKVLATLVVRLVEQMEGFVFVAEAALDGSEVEGGDVTTFERILRAVGGILLEIRVKFLRFVPLALKGEGMAQEHGHARAFEREFAAALKRLHRFRKLASLLQGAS